MNAGGGIVFRYKQDQMEPEVLMIFRNGCWDLPKGKMEPDESKEMCAVREVAEEVGSGLPAIVSDLGSSYHEYEENGMEFAKTTYWYSMIFTSTENLTPQKEEGIEKVEWVLLSEAYKLLGYDNLRSILKNFQAQKKV